MYSEERKDNGKCNFYDFAIIQTFFTRKFESKIEKITFKIIEKKQDNQRQKKVSVSMSMLSQLQQNRNKTPKWSNG